MSSLTVLRDRVPGALLALRRLAAASPAVLLACSSALRAEARQKFAAQFMCPEDRVVVVEQHGRAYVPGPPPAEITRDPGRYAVWQHSVAQIAAKMADRTYYLTRGCGHIEALSCIDVSGYNEPADPFCYPIVPGEADTDLIDP
jgi:hypothetical protein